MPTKTKKTKPKTKTTKSVAKTKPIAPSPSSKPVTFLNLPSTITLQTIHLQYALIALIALIAIFIYFFKNQFVVALVNGKPITRTAYNQAVLEQSGSSILQRLVTEELIKQEAQKQNLTVTNQEVEEEIASIEQNLSSQGQDFEQLLTLQGTTRAGLANQIRLQKLLGQMAAVEQATQEEIDNFLEENAELLPEDATEEELNDIARQQIESQNQNAAVQDFLSQLESNAQVNYWLSI